MCHHCTEEAERYGYCRTHWLELAPQARAFVALFSPATVITPALFLTVTRA
jgi:hypothetical protein